MDELKRQVLNTIKVVCQLYDKAIKDADDQIDAEQGIKPSQIIDTSKIGSDLADIMAMLDEKFIEANQRIFKKKGWFK